MRIEANVQRLLSLCGRHRAGATFFVLGETAERHRGMVKEIRAAGHEVASHGYRHRPVNELSPEAFAEDLKASLAVLTEIVGEKILGYRAPSWSVHHDWDWFYKVLERNGLAYDASVFPAKTFLYGDRSAPRYPFRVGQIAEIPASTLTALRRRIPFASGFFFRLFPGWFIRRGIRLLNKKGFPAMICLHPREIDPQGPRLRLPPRERFIHYVHIRNAEQKLERLLASFEFSCIKEYLSL